MAAYRDIKLYDLNSYEKDEVIQAFDLVQDRIKDCYTLFGVRSEIASPFSGTDDLCVKADAQWTNDAKKLAAAETKDKARVTRMNTRISSVSTATLIAVMTLMLSTEVDGYRWGETHRRDLR